MKFEADGFSRICINFCTEPEQEFFLNSSKVACAYLKFDRHGYDELPTDGSNHFYAEGIRTGLAQMEKFTAIPRAEILQGLEKFEARDFTNEWIHKQKVFKIPSLRAALKCELTQSDFTLRLEIIKGEVVIFDEVILKTDPDEVAFGYRFRDIQVEEGKLVVTSKVGGNLFEKSLNEL
ncbi:hypothetical protein [Luteolibacter sp. Populi]|uniref:hypothetical protein n=1 Tax=Luteolibacter sp. Populi TaxID=3230487 RepID=UPI0034670154